MNKLSLSSFIFALAVINTGCLVNRDPITLVCKGTSRSEDGTHSLNQVSREIQFIFDKEAISKIESRDESAPIETVSPAWTAVINGSQKYAPENYHIRNDMGLSSFMTWIAVDEKSLAVSSVYEHPDSSSENYGLYVNRVTLAWNETTEIFPGKHHSKQRTATETSGTCELVK